MSASRFRWALAMCLALLGILAGSALGDLGESADRPRQHAVISAGAAHTCAIDALGTVRCWGADDAGQLGDGPAVNGLPPVAVQLGQPAISVAAGGAHTCALVADGGVRCWGSNIAGEVGSAVPGQHPVPAAAVPLGRPALAVAAGNGHTCALLADGSVRCWGANGLGQLEGVPGPDSSSPAAAVSLGVPARALTAGDRHTCALLGDASVRCWGAAAGGILGDADPVLIAAGAGLGSQVQLGQAARAISAGGDTTCSLLANGSVRCWGSDANGQLGDGGPVPGDPAIGPAPATFLGTAGRAIAVGGSAACALLANDMVRCWGGDQEGQLGDGGAIPGVASSVPAATVALGGPARAITAGGLHVCALLADGALRCWGGDASGQLGDGPPPAAASAPSRPVGLPAFASPDSADLSLAAQVSAAGVAVGEAVTITVTLANAGVDPAEVAVSVPLGAGLTLTSATPSQGSYAAGTGRWSAGTLTAGASATLTLSVTGAAPGATATVAEVATSSALDPDSVPGDGLRGQDDRAAVSLTVTAAPGQTPPSGETPAPPGDRPTTPRGRLAPGELTLRLVPPADPRAPFVFDARGRLIIPGAARRACSGRVTITVRRGKRPIQVRRVALRNRDGACVYTLRLTFPRRPAGARRLTVTARFGGNVRLTAKAAEPVSARLG